MDFYPPHMPDMEFGSNDLNMCVFLDFGLEYGHGAWWLQVSFQSLRHHARMVELEASIKSQIAPFLDSPCSFFWIDHFITEGVKKL